MLSGDCVGLWQNFYFFLNSHLNIVLVQIAPWLPAVATFASPAPPCAKFHKISSRRKMQMADPGSSFFRVRNAPAKKVSFFAAKIIISDNFEKTRPVPETGQEIVTEEKEVQRLTPCNESYDPTSFLLTDPIRDFHFRSFFVDSR